MQEFCTTEMHWDIRLVSLNWPTGRTLNSTLAHRVCHAAQGGETKNSPSFLPSLHHRRGRRRLFTLQSALHFIESDVARNL